MSYYLLLSFLCLCYKR